MLAKYIHVTCVILTISFYFIRGLWMVFDSDLQFKKWPKRLAPVIDTILLVSAIVFAIQIHQYPFVHSWLTAKVIGLLLYIGLGVVALSYGRTRQIKITAWIASLVCFAYIVSVALTKNPWIFIVP